MSVPEFTILLWENIREIVFCLFCPAVQLKTSTMPFMYTAHTSRTAVIYSTNTF